MDYVEFWMESEMSDEEVKIGRPTDYTDELVDRICERLRWSIIESHLQDRELGAR